MDVYKIINTKDHFNTVKSTSQYAVFKFKEVDKKLIYMNIRKNEIITSIPNRFEKS